MIRFERWAGLPAAVAMLALAEGVYAASHYHRLGLTLTHYDARGHLVVARRIFDSITPGWQQIGAVWLPLPHLLNAIPVQIDMLYRTGASGVAISIASFGLLAYSAARLVMSSTGSGLAAAVAGLLVVSNPNLLYLQSTPMTEPLLIALITISVALLMSWLSSAPSEAPSPWVVGVSFALACLTRYEAWPVTVAALPSALWTLWRRGARPLDATRRVTAIAIYPAAAVAAFAVFSRVVIGEWFVGNDFFVPENKALGDPMMAAAEIGWGARMLSGALLAWIGGAGVAASVAIGLVSRKRADALTVLALLGMAAISWTAFLKGHPFRIRYMVPLMAIEAIGAGLTVGFVPERRVRAACAMALLLLVGYELRPLDPSAPMVTEAQWDRPNAPLRAQVTACIAQPLGGDKIMASMGSLGHYMQEASRSGLAIRDFLHEGNGDIWLAALEQPRPYAAWMLIEEKAEGGDMLAQRSREKPSFFDGYARVCEEAGLALYKRKG